MFLKSQYLQPKNERTKNTTDNIDALNPGYAGLLGTGRINACRALGGTPSPKVVASASQPKQFALYQNSPNPFNPETEISFSLPERTQVSLIIYNILGEKVKTLVNETRDAGTYSVQWNGRDEAGNSVANGIYFYRLKTETFEKTMKMVLMK